MSRPVVSLSGLMMRFVCLPSLTLSYAIYHAPRTCFLQDFITTTMSDSPDFQDSVSDLKVGIDFLGNHLSKHSVPFFSPRYAAHMNSDISSE